MLKFHAEATVQWRFPDEKVFYAARIVSQGEAQLALRMLDRPGRTPVKGQDLVLRVDVDDYHTEVLETSDGATLFLRPVMSEQRRYFRVDDYFPVIARKSARGKSASGRSRVIPVFGFESAELELPEELDDPAQMRIWRALHGLNSKLSIVAYHMEVTQDPLSKQADRAGQIIKLIEQADAEARLGDGAARHQPPAPRARRKQAHQHQRHRDQVRHGRAAARRRLPGPAAAAADRATRRP